MFLLLLFVVLVAFFHLFLLLLLVLELGLLVLGWPPLPAVLLQAHTRPILGGGGQGGIGGGRWVGVRAGDAFLDWK